MFRINFKSYCRRLCAMLFNAINWIHIRKQPYDIYESYASNFRIQNI